MGSVRYFQEHIKAEFYAQGVGWVPVDLSSAVLHDTSDAKLRYFGNDAGRHATTDTSQPFRRNDEACRF